MHLYSFFFLSLTPNNYKSEDWDSSGSEVSNKPWNDESLKMKLQWLVVLISLFQCFCPNRRVGCKSKNHWGKDSLLALLNNHRNINRQSSPVGLLQGKKINATTIVGSVFGSFCLKFPFYFLLPIKKWSKLEAAVWIRCSSSWYLTASIASPLGTLLIAYKGKINLFFCKSPFTQCKHSTANGNLASNPCLSNLSMNHQLQGIISIRICAKEEEAISSGSWICSINLCL